VAGRYKELIDALYGDKEEIEIEADIKYRDGKGYRMKTKVKIKQLDLTE
jgi:long-chain acyl-CoA synthetase